MIIIGFLALYALLIFGVATIGHQLQKSNEVLAAIRDHQEAQSACAKEQVRISSGIASAAKWRAS